MAFPGVPSGQEGMQVEFKDNERIKVTSLLKISTGATENKFIQEVLQTELAQPKTRFP